MGKFDLDSLALDARNDGRAFRTLLNASESLIAREVNKFAVGVNAIHRADYTSQAISSLYDSVSKYDPEKGSFSFFASRCINQAILDYIRNNQGLMNIGSTKLNEIKKLNKARAIIKEKDLEENEENLMKYSGIDSRKTLETVKWAEKVNGTLSLDASVQEDGESSFLDFVNDDYSFEDDVYRKEEVFALYRAISTLNKEEKFIIINSSGLYGKKIITNKAMAKILNVSENTIVNRKNAIKAKLKILLESWAS